ncbi:hypothetical protein AK812_SmicGene24117 [Symbiodinium microadriaticum]|uniref:Uncharacterized protein n=1 Tax=Symbiodinium microadriaticum TaxID=2951 RepID=A0A1Q9DFK0_SYMMI|nr:hypothetical protein AK812_SmicGene24117 [Symbiodinium microadriaticum]
MLSRAVVRWRRDLPTSAPSARGPSKLKDSFYVEDISKIEQTDLEFPGQAASVMLNQVWTEITHAGRFLLDTVQLLGRWGSDAVKVYVQEAPLYRGDPHHRGHENDKPEQISEMVEHYLDTLRQKFWVVNTSRVSETSTDSDGSVGQYRMNTIRKWHLLRCRIEIKVIMADATLTDAAALAGIDLSTDRLARYLHAIGIRSHATIAAYVHEDAVVNGLITKLKAGVTVGTTEYKLADIESTAAQPDKDTIPKSLPAGVYSKLVEDYNSITIDDVRRTFPEKLLLGAEKVLARMYHEHHTSKLYTATPLGEIMAQRVWTSFNTINSNRKKKDSSEKKLILDDKNQISEKSQEEWDVRGQWMLIDATQAIRWAWILLKYDSETSINKYVDWFQGLIRKTSQRTFTAITEDLMVDVAKVNEILHQPLTKKTRKRATIPNSVSFDITDDMGTVAHVLPSMATATYNVDVAANSPDMVDSDAVGPDAAHSDPDGALQSGADGATATDLVAQGLSRGTGADHRITDDDNRVSTLCKSLVGHLPVVHLSFFDGIGVASEALRRISDNVLLTMSWETNTACADFTHERFGSIQMGDVADIDIDKIAAYIDQQLGQQQFILLITAGPPCPDFSRMKKSPKGADGDSGWMFKHMIDVEYNLRLRFQGRPFETVIENVVPHPSLRDRLLEMTEPSCMRPVVIDASDGGLVQRKRLWWTSIDWQDVENKLARNTPWSTSWKTDDDWPRAHWQAHVSYESFATNVPLYTTHRWQDDHHRYPPWQYEEQFLVQWPDGTSSTAPTELREQLQGLPVGYTEKLAGDTQRDVALGNAWHLPTAIWILFLVLLGTAEAAIPR